MQQEACRITIMPSYLFSSPDRKQIFQQALASGNTSAEDMLRALEEPEEDHGEIVRHLHELNLAWLQEDDTRAHQAYRRLLAELPPPYPEDLGKAAQALALCCCMDVGEKLFSEEELQPLREHCVRMALSFTEISPANPHMVTNNWYALTHGGCILCCLSANREELSELESWAIGRLRAFCHHFGNAGLYHEGTGYIAYTLSMLFPVILALRNRRGLDLCEEFPALRHSMLSMMMGTARHGDQVHMLDWNDTGRHAARLNPVLPGILLSHPEDQPALKKYFDRSLGAEGVRAWRCGYRGLPLAVALYPFNLPVVDPNEHLPRWVLDSRQGLGWWRSRWGHGEESVFGFYARHSHLKPGHAHDDAASIRLMSRGRVWMCGAGQARTESRWQSSLTHADPAQRPAEKPFAYISSQHLSSSGGKIGMDLRHHLEAYGERYLSWRENDAGNFQCALLDLVDEHQRPPRSWTWNLSFPRDLEVRLHEDKAGLTLRDPECGLLQLRFLQDLPDELHILEMPPSTRSYSGGRSEDYPGDRYLEARFDQRQNLTILTAMTVVGQAEGAPELSGTLHEVNFGDSRWAHPFQGSILSSFNPVQHRSNLQLAPAGAPRPHSS